MSQLQKQLYLIPVFFTTFLLLPRLRLVFHVEDIQEGSNPQKWPLAFQTIAFFTLLASLIMLPLAAANWINKYSKRHLSCLFSNRQSAILRNNYLVVTRKIALRRFTAPK